MQDHVSTYIQGTVTLKLSYLPSFEMLSKDGSSRCLHHFSSCTNILLYTDILSYFTVELIHIGRDIYIKGVNELPWMEPH